MRIVIVGVGETGWELADGLSRDRRHELILVDQDAERCDALSREFDALVLHGDGTRPEVLKEARVQEAQALVAATGSDAINTVIAMLARRFDVKRIVVALKERGLRSACEEIGVAGIVAPKIVAAAEMRNLIYGEERIDLSVLEKGDIRLAELQADRVAGTSLGDLGLPEAVLALAVLRGQEVIFPSRRVRLEEGDAILVLAEREEALEQARRALKLGENRVG